MKTANSAQFLVATEITISRRSKFIHTEIPSPKHRSIWSLSVQYHVSHSPSDQFNTKTCLCALPTTQEEVRSKLTMFKLYQGKTPLVVLRASRSKNLRGLQLSRKCIPSTPAPPRKRRRPNQELLERLARCEELLSQCKCIHRLSPEGDSPKDSSEGSNSSQVGETLSIAGTEGSSPR